MQPFREILINDSVERFKTEVKNTQSTFEYFKSRAEDYPSLRMYYHVTGYELYGANLAEDYALELEKLNILSKQQEDSIFELKSAINELISSNYSKDLLNIADKLNYRNILDLPTYFYRVMQIKIRLKRLNTKLQKVNAINKTIGVITDEFNEIFTKVRDDLDTLNA